MKTTKLMLAVPVVALLVASMPTQAEARTKTVLKYGAIGLGAAALANMANQNSYYQQPYYGGYYYQQPYYGGYYSYPTYSYSYSSYPSYGGYYGGYYY